MRNILASVGAQRAMRMSLVAEVATAYFQLIAMDNELAVVRRTLATRSEGVEQARLRFEGGLTSEMVYQQAQVEYATTAALIPELENRIKLAENGISLLMGEYPGWEIVRSRMNTQALMPDSLPAGLPSALLQRRPDVQESEQQLRAAMAAVGIAYADRFPLLTISLTGGWENDALENFLRSPFSYVAGNLAAPVFGFGRKQAKYRAAMAAYDKARLEYEQKVLEVFREAADAVATYRHVREVAALKGSFVRRSPRVCSAGPPAIPCRQYQLYRRTGRPTALFRRPDRTEQRRARRAPCSGRALQSVGRPVGRPERRSVTGQKRSFLSRRPPDGRPGRTFAPRKDSEKTYNQTERAYSRPVRSYGFARPGYCGRMTEGHSQFSLISGPPVERQKRNGLSHRILRMRTRFASPSHRPVHGIRHQFFTANCMYVHALV